jgi:hypothetical protein
LRNDRAGNGRFVLLFAATSSRRSRSFCQAGAGGAPIDWSDHDGELHIFGHTRLYGKLVMDASSSENLPFGPQL